MKRLTTDNQDHILASLNLFYAKGNEVWVRGGGPEPDYDDTTLVELIHRAARAHGLNITADEPESLGDEMYDAMFDGVDTVEWIVALLHTAAIQATEMRHRLMSIEDILGDEYDLDRLRELAQADREKNDPLTLDELRGMRGKWVWVVSPDKDLTVPAWAYVGANRVFTYWEYDNDELVGRVVYNLCDYGAWIAYRNPIKTVMPGEEQHGV